MTTANAQIAAHLNIAESAISSVEEWASVLFVKFTTGRPRFVSKKVVKETKEMEPTVEQQWEMLSKRFPVWEGNGLKRIYFDFDEVANILGLSKNQKRKRPDIKFYFDSKDGYGSRQLSESEFETVKTEVEKW